MRNRELHEKYRNFIVASLRLLNKREIPSVGSDKISVQRESDGTKTFITKEVMGPNFSGFVRDHENGIKRLQEFESCLNFLMELDVTKEYFQVGREPKMTREDMGEFYLIPVLLYFLCKNKSLDSNAKVFEEVYGGVEDFLYTRRSNFLASAPLYNFEMENDVLNLENNLKIRKLSDEELGELCTPDKERVFVGCVMPFHEVMRIDCVMEMPYSTEKGESMSDQKVREIFNKLISTLRLFKSGDFGYTRIKSTPLSWQSMVAIIMHEVSNKRYFGSKYKQYKLTKSEIEEFKKFWNKFSTLDLSKNKFLEIAIKRFNYGCERDKPEDKLIDYMIALGALFLKEEEKTELVYRLSVRAAIFLGKNKKIYEDVRRAYHLRSKIVHGSETPLSEDFGQLVLKIEDHLRESIKKFLKLIKKQNYEEIIKSTDKQIFI